MGIRCPRQRGPDTSFRLSYRGRRAKSSQNCDRLARAVVEAISVVSRYAAVAGDLRAAFAAFSAGSADDGIVPRERQIDHDDVQQCSERFGGHNLGHGRSSGGSSQPMWPMLLDPIENAGPARAQQTHIVCQECQSDREHPEPHDRQGAENPAKRQQDPQWNSQPPTGRLPDEANR